MEVLNAVYNFYVAHPWLGAFMLWVFLNAVNALPAPDDGSGKFYKWLFAFLNAFTGSIPRILATQFSGTAQKLGILPKVGTTGTIEGK